MGRHSSGQTHRELKGRRVASGKLLWILRTAESDQLDARAGFTPALVLSEWYFAGDRCEVSGSDQLRGLQLPAWVAELKGIQLATSITRSVRVYVLEHLLVSLPSLIQPLNEHLFGRLLVNTTIE